MRLFLVGHVHVFVLLFDCDYLIVVLQDCLAKILSIHRLYRSNNTCCSRHSLQVSCFLTLEPDL